MTTMTELGKRFNIPVVKAYEGSADSMEHLIAETREQKGIEGWVIRFDDGHMLKIKAEEYLRFHKTKDSLSQEKNVIDLLLSENVDDAKAFMMPEDRRRVELFEDQFWAGVEETALSFGAYYDTLVQQGIDRKTWALEYMKAQNDKNRFASSIVFNLYNGKDALKTVIEIIAKNISSQTKVDECRILWGNVQWSYSFGQE
jgi:RNA ligase